ncbi:MAG: molybdate ABC transporter substrate-binding protein, partial [Thermoplasmata archaeon]|nr:molybdate ABC transporter substrate-binding protein [Thermoplasmata archaeon]
TSVNVNYASSGILRTQIEQGAPVDVFASASIEHMDILQTKELILIDSRTNFARNSLVLVIPRNSNGNTTLEDLKHADQIALGDPAHVPAGIYAKEMLESIDMWTEIEDKTIYAANVKQVLDYVFRREVDAGFVYATDVTERVEVARKVPDSLHSPIIYTLSIMKESKNPETAYRFVQFVAESDEIFAQNGFILIKEV